MDRKLLANVPTWQTYQRQLKRGEVVTRTWPPGGAGGDGDDDDTGATSEGGDAHESSGGASGDVDPSVASDAARAVAIARAAAIADEP